MMWGQGELFALATKEEVQHTKFLLEKYNSMVSQMNDFERFEKEMSQVAVDGESARRIDSEEYDANKTANAVILMEKQRWVYQEYSFYTSMLLRAFGLITDEEVQRVIDLRFFQGLSRNRTIWALSGTGWSPSTIDRRQEEGITSIANTLRMYGFFDRETFF